MSKHDEYLKCVTHTRYDGSFEQWIQENFSDPEHEENQPVNPAEVKK